MWKAEARLNAIKEEQQPNFEAIDHLLAAPDAQMSAEVKELLKDLRGEPHFVVLTMFRQALDMGARYGMASNFVMIALDAETIRMGGKTTDPTPWREYWEENE